MGGGSGLVAGVVFASSLGLILFRPRFVADWAAALAGGLLMIGLQILPWQQALSEIASNWDVFLFFLGLGLASSTADQAGVFGWAAQRVVAWSKGSQWRLLLGTYAIGVLVTAVLSNDATALLLTPVVFAIATRAGVDPRPYAFCCALVANAASFLLPVSNPSNLLVLARAPLPLGVFLAELALPAALALLVTLGGLLLVFRHALAVPFAVPSQEATLRPQAVTRVGLGLVLLACAYVVAAAEDWPVGIVSVVGSLVLLALLGRPRAVLKEVPWAIFPLFGGLLLLVAGGERTGLFSPIGKLVSLGPLALSLGLAVVANLINNLPAALVAASSLGALDGGPQRSQLAAAAIVGVNLGPNLTTIGSLATMLWLLLLRRRGLDVSPLSYVRVGGVITVPALVAAAGGLWLTLR